MTPIHSDYSQARHDGRCKAPSKESRLPLSMSVSPRPSPCCRSPHTNIAVLFAPPHPRYNAAWHVYSWTPRTRREFHLLRTACWMVDSSPLSPPLPSSLSAAARRIRCRKPGTRRESCSTRCVYCGVLAAWPTACSLKLRQDLGLSVVLGARPRLAVPLGGDVVFDPVGVGNHVTHLHQQGAARKR